MRSSRSALVAWGAAVVLAAAWLGGCGSPAPKATPSPSVSQAPVQAYTDTGSSATKTPAPLTAAMRAQLAQVHLVRVSIGADGHYISVQFKAPPKLARKWRSGPLSVTDEISHQVYDKIPNVPLLGSLYAPPHKEGQVGYVMFANVPPLERGARVAIVLGDFKKAHVIIQ